MSNSAIKKPHTGPTDWTEQQLADVIQCIDDPIWFMRNFVKVQHPLLGAVPFEPYPYQERIVDALHRNRFAIVMTGRQQGKSLCYNTYVRVQGVLKPVGSLIPLNLQKKIVSWLERKLVAISL